MIKIYLLLFVAAAFSFLVTTLLLGDYYSIVRVLAVYGLYMLIVQIGKVVCYSLKLSKKKKFLKSIS